MKYCASINKTAHFQLCRIFLGFSNQNHRHTQCVVVMASPQIYTTTITRSITPKALKSTQPQFILPHHSQVYFPVGSPSLSHCQVDFLTIVSLNIVYLLSCHHKIRVEENVTSVEFHLSGNLQLPYLIGQCSLKGIPADNTEGKIKVWVNSPKQMLQSGTYSQTFLFGLMCLDTINIYYAAKLLSLGKIRLHLIFVDC